MNIQKNLIKVEDIPKEVENKAYNDIFLDEIISGASILYQLSLNLIDLPLAHVELIYWDQPSMVHVDKFSTNHTLLKFMGEKTPHKWSPPPSKYVYKLDPIGYFGEEEVLIKKKWFEKRKKKRETSSGENSFGAPLDDSQNELKIKDVSDSENLSKTPKDGYFILPTQDHRPPISLVLIEETRPVNISLTEEPHITYIATSLSPEQVDLLIEIIHENIGHFSWSYQDMLGLYPKLVVHNLAVDPKAKPIK